MNIVKTGLLGLMLGLIMALGNTNATPIIEIARNVGGFVAKNTHTIGDVFHSMRNAHKASYAAFSASLLANGHPVLANHPYATVAGVIAVLAAFEISALYFYYLCNKKISKIKKII